MLRVGHPTIQVPGSATMVLAKMDGSTGVLDVCNLGDAGLRVIRNGKVIISPRFCISLIHSLVSARMEEFIGYL